MNALYTAEEAGFQLRTASARFLITVPQLAERALEAAQAAGVEEVFSIGDAPGTTPFEELLAPPGTPPPRPAIDPATHVVALPFSSGTTGLTKGVMLTHRNLVANLCQYEPVRAIGEDDRVIAILPFFHIYGQTLVLNDALRRGARIVTMPRFDLAQFLAAIEQHRITACYVAPPVVLALAKHPLVADFDLSSLRFVTSGAAPLDAELQAAAERRVGCRVQQGYGLTEASPVTHHAHQDDENVHGTIGTLLPSTEARARRCGDGRGRRAGRAGGDLGARAAGHARLPRRRGATAATLDERRLAAHGRHRDDRRGRPLPCRRPPQGTDQIQGLPGAARAAGRHLAHAPADRRRLRGARPRRGGR